MCMQKTIQALRVLSWFCLTSILLLFQVIGALLVVPMTSHGIAPYGSFCLGWAITIPSLLAFGIVHEKVFMSKCSCAKTCSIIMLVYDFHYCLWIGGGGIMTFLADQVVRYRVSGFFGVVIAILYALVIYLLWHHAEKNRGVAW